MDLPDLYQWYQQAPGKAVLERERILLNQLLSELNGSHILQIDMLNDERLLNASPIKHKVRVNTEISAGITGSVVAANLTELPFLPNSIDVVVLNHILGFFDEPELLLKEIDSILKPEGHLVVVGFNPFSLWGLIKLYVNTTLPPWQEKFIPAIKVRYWLNRLGLSVIDYRTVFFPPPLENANILRKLDFMEALGQLYFQNLGAVYILVAQKKRIPLTLMPAKTKRQKHELTAGVLEPTTRIRHHD